MVKNDIKKSLFKYSALSLILLAVSFAEINGLHPFALALFAALVFSGASSFVLLVPLSVGQFLACADWTVAAAGVSGAVLIAIIDFLLRRKEQIYGVAVMICLTALAACPDAAA